MPALQSTRGGCRFCKLLSDLLLSCRSVIKNKEAAGEIVSSCRASRSSCVVASHNGRGTDQHHCKSAYVAWRWATERPQRWVLDVSQVGHQEVSLS